MALNPQLIIDNIVRLSAGRRIWIAYSGGVDSHVLLHLLATSNHPELNALSAIHVDHGLNSASTTWAQHCADTADDLNIDFQLLHANVKNIDSLGMEAAAREARYLALQNALTADDIILTAQHQQDQAETLLLQLFRGAGPKGLASMAEQFQLGDTTAIRPLLTIPQSDIVAYAQQHSLQWVEDPSNIETRWNRNYIRHNVLPEIKKRWPSVVKTISRSADNCAEANELLTELAQHDLAGVGSTEASDYLSISKLLVLSSARCRNLIRHFIEWKQLALPSSAVLHHIIDNVCLAKEDSTPMVAYANVEIRRFRDKLYFMSSLPEHNASQIIECNSIDDLKINKHITLNWQKTTGQGLKQEAITAGLTVRFRQGGEKILLPNQTHHKSLKHLFQEWQVPPWQRDRIPLLFSREKLIAVVGYAVDNDNDALADIRNYSPKSITS